MASLAETKKKKVQKPLKNVLTSPYSQYWSTLKDGDLEILHQSLKKNLPALVNLKSRIPWKHLRKLDREDRIKRLDEKKEKIKATESNKPIVEMRSFLSIGLNETSRSLSRGELSCLVLDGDRGSSRLAGFLLNLSLVQHVPALVCPGLLQLTLARFGFKAIALGIRTKVNDFADEMQKLTALQNTIVETFCKELSTKSILCDRMKRILAEIQKKSDFNNDNLQTQGTEESSECTDNFAEELETISEQIDHSSLDKEVTSNSELPDNLYRYRTNKTYRSFVPQVTNRSASSTSEGFISVASCDPIKQTKTDKMVSMQKRIKKTDSMFFIDTGDLVKSPVVKKVKPNPKKANVKLKKSQ